MGLILNKIHTTFLQAEVPSHTPAATLVSDKRCVRLYVLSCCRIAHLATDRLLGPLRKHTGGRQVHSNEEVEVAFREGLVANAKGPISTSTTFFNSH
jgi:hypothetical protein